MQGPPFWRKNCDFSLLTTLFLLLTACGAACGNEGALLPPPTSPDPVLELPHHSPTAFPKTTAQKATPDFAAVLSTAAVIASPTPVPTLCSPLAEHPLSELPEIVSDPYRPPPPGKEERHHGVDFSYYRRGERLSILGVGVQSIFSGRVAASIQESFPYGNVVIVETPLNALPADLAETLGIKIGESVYSLYAHLGSSPLVALGDTVVACQGIGEVGKSGNAGVSHLHLEMRIGPAGRSFTSMAFYTTQATEEERANYLLWRISGIFRHFDPMQVLVP